MYRRKQTNNQVEDVTIRNEYTTVNSIIKFAARHGYPTGRKAGDVFKDCDACPEMVVIPAGQFYMGDISGFEGDDEKPVHLVQIDHNFAVGKYEVTLDEWDACASNGGCGGYRPDDRGWGRGRRPVINVSWVDARRYVSWLSRKTGQSYRLLSESEWEYVARSGTRTKYSFGNSISVRDANFSGSFGKTVAVGSYWPNGFGLYDVHGNVFEWVEDCWHETYSGSPTDYSESPTDYSESPTDGSS
jgi:formylglycine-generating enzyme required for sulfatase activity